MAQPEDRDVPEQEKRQVSALVARIERAVQLRKTWDTESLPKLRRLTWGTQSAAQPHDAQATTRTNLIFATQATLLPHIYAKNPEIAVSVAEAVAEDEYEHWKQFAKTSEIFLARTIVEEANLKRRAKANVRSAMTTAIGWLKLTFQENLDGDPIIIRRINDAQDNLRQIEYLTGKVKETPNQDEVLRQREELRVQVQAMMQSNEVKIFKGFALDRVQTEDVFVLDESIVDFDDYVNADEIAHRVWMTDEQYEQTFGAKPLSGTKEYGAPNDLGAQADTTAPLTGKAKEVKYRAVFEIWSKKEGVVYTIALGAPGYCREPYTPKGLPQRWYPFYALGFNLVEGRFRPLSDVELLEKLQEEYNQTRYYFAEARKEAIPVRIFRKAGNLGEDDIKALQNRRARDFIGVEGNPQVPLNQDIAEFPGVKIDPAAYDVTIIRNDMDMLVGLSDASRANLIEAKTATEAEIMRQALQTRVAERQDANEDMISDIARDALEIGLQRFTTEEIQQLAGPKAVWREQQTGADGQQPLTISEIFHKIGVQVRAGSTGKPNQQKERETWTQLLPVINETMQRVMELRMSGNMDMAEANTELLRETIRRFDERLDIDSIIPPVERDDQGNAVAQNNAMQQAAQMQQQMQALQEEYQKCQEEKQQLEQQLMIAKQNDQSKAAEAQAKGAIEQARENSKQQQMAQQQAVEQQRLTEEYDMKRETSAATLEIEARKAVVQAVTAYVISATKPTVTPGAEGKPGSVTEPDFDAVMAQATRLTEKLERAAGLAAEPKTMEQLDAT
jgi:hypothetical protein